MKSVCTIKMSLESQVIVPLTERFDLSEKHGDYSNQERQYRVELSEWIEKLSKVVLEMENHMIQRQKEIAEDGVSSDNYANQQLNERSARE